MFTRMKSRTKASYDRVTDMNNYSTANGVSEALAGKWKPPQAREGHPEWQQGLELSQFWLKPEPGGSTPHRKRQEPLLELKPGAPGCLPWMGTGRGSGRFQA